MNNLEIDQVLSLKIRFNNSNDISTKKHPYLIVDIDNELNYVEIAQIDSLKGKEFKAARRSNKTIFYDNPVETVIDKDSYVQLDNTIKLENFVGLAAFRRQKEKLSENKLNDVLTAYKKYHLYYEIDENKNIYMDEQEIKNLNSD